FVARPGPPRRHLRARHRRPVRRGHAVRRARGGTAGARDAAAAAAVAGGGARAPGGDARVRSRARREPGRRVAMGAAARRVRRHLHGLRRGRLRASVGGVLVRSETGTRVLGAVTVAALALLAVMALVVTPADINQQDDVRLIYIHVPMATVMYIAFGVTAVASALYLVRRTRAR